MTRSVTKAQKVASQKAEEDRQRKREEIRVQIFSDFCTCGRCSAGDYSDRCISNKDLARTLTTLKILTVRGSETWQTTTVTRLFK